MCKGPEVGAYATNLKKTEVSVARENEQGEE